MEPNKPKKKGASFWAAFRESKNGTAKKKVINKLSGETITQTGFWFVMYRDKYGRTITDGKGGYGSKPLAKAGLYEFRKVVAGNPAPEVTLEMEKSAERAIPAASKKFLSLKINSSRRKGTYLVYEQKLPKLVAYIEDLKKPSMRVDQFTWQDVFDFKDWLISKGHNNGGVRGTLRVIKTFFNWSKDKGYYSTPNPFTQKNSSGHTVLSANVLPNTHNPRYLTDMEIRILAEATRIIGKGNGRKKTESWVYVEDLYSQAARETENVRNILRARRTIREIIQVGIATCMREGELSHLKREWVNAISPEKCIIVIPAQDGEFDTKSGKARNIVIRDPEIVSILTRTDSGYIWTTETGERWVESRICWSFRSVVDRARRYLGFKGHCSPHCLRHTGAKKYLQNGGYITDLKDRLGHSSINTTMIYKQFENPEAQEAVSSRIRVDMSPLLKVVQ